MKAEIKHISDVSAIGDTVEFTVVLDSWYSQDVFDAVNALSGADTPYIISIEKQQKQRSNNANAYCWVLCQKIAEKVGSTKETVYRKNIREVGSFELVECWHEGVARFIRSWESNGIGWLAEIMHERNGYTTIIAYYGSSTYTTKEMARLIDSLIEEAKALGIETMPPDELERLKTSWKGG